MPDPKNPADADGSFETNLEKLEDIVAQLEAGAKPLDESLALYEQGVAALKRCHAVLDKAEKRIKLLVKNAGGEVDVQDARGAVAYEPPAVKPPGNRRPKQSEQPMPENSAQTVDSEPASPQNPATSSDKKRSTDGKPNAGGSLFGNTP